MWSPFIIALNISFAFLLGNERVGGSGKGLGEGGGKGKGGEMTQSLYAHMNKGNKKRTK
jgi:hypothetical protein